MLPEALPIFPMHLWKIMKKPSSSVCHSLQHTMSFPMQMGVPKSLYFVCSLRVCLGRNGTMCAIRGLQMLSEAPLVPLKHLGKVMKHSNSNGCLTSQYSNAFSMRRGYLESPHFVYNLRVVRTWQKWHGVDNRELIYAPRSSSYLPDISMEGYETSQQQWMSLLAA